MQTTIPFVSRQEVIEAYVRYDAKKKGKPVPPLDRWDWSDPNWLDAALGAAGFKHGILSGFLEWRGVAMTLEDLRCCAVVDTISGGGPRDLRGLERLGLAKNPSRPTSWSEKVRGGHVFEQDEPILLRSAVASEAPAAWYLEDGSGRAAAIVANASAYHKHHPVAFAYLGMHPDPDSQFMLAKFPSLLA